MTELLPINRASPVDPTTIAPLRQPTSTLQSERFPDRDVVDVRGISADNGTIGPNPDPPDIDNGSRLVAESSGTPPRAEVATGYGNAAPTPSDPTRFSFLA
ncbi:hypothetical protein [Acanthopleuribacter pedis]|uniref:Uncharacterized protein n=1 Tax=Acanthopleuribacter pedis TaxID=442870 RepID=A0A8J7U556_9BACT|nr:hypothetical protein [Acanthopleuribacter pedis]MBO1321347.1 hypothetical protein [Acanthopleuribacter pedis]